MKIATCLKGKREEMTEKIMVFSRIYMVGFKNLSEISTSYRDIQHLKYVCGTNSSFRNRDKMEVDESYKQIIPYIVIRRGKKILSYMRSKTSGEGRLHNKWSIGVGGHINPIDKSKHGIMMTLSNAINRELLEELEWGDAFIHTINNITEYGVLYDPSNPVGLVHVGYVLVVDLPVGKEEVYPFPREDTIADCKWFTAKQVAKLKNLESWSEIVIKSLAKEVMPSKEMLPFPRQ